MISLDDRVSIIQSELLALEEIIRVVEVNSWAPCALLRILVPSCRWVVCYENSLLGQTFYTSLLGIVCNAPREIVHILLEELPCGAQVLCDVELFVDFARIITKFITVCPCGGKCPLFFSWMELELMYLFA